MPDFALYMLLPGIPVFAFWVFVGLAVIIQGISKSGFAGGAGILSLPLMMLVMPVDKVAATMLPILMLCDLNAIYHHRDNADWALIRKIFPAILLGIFAGAAVWWWVGQQGVEHYGTDIKRFVGLIAIFFGLYIGAKEASLSWVRDHKMGTIACQISGISAGFTSTIAHAAGPIVSLYMFSQGMGKTLFVGTVAWTFTFINWCKLPFYIAVGLIDIGVLGFGLLLVPLIPLGSWLGHWMHHRVSEKSFNRVIMVLTILGGAQMLFDVPLIQMVAQGLAR